MSIPDDLSGQLQVGRIQQEELGQLLLEQFHGARAVGLNEIVYPADAEAYAVKLHYDGDGSLVKVTAGATLTPSDLETLQHEVAEELLADTGTLVGRLVLFTRLPVDGWFRYRNAFQILAVPPDAPHPPHLAADHPLILEFRFPNTRNTMVAVIRRAVRERELELLLNAFLFPEIHSLGSASVRGRWVLEPRKAGESLRVKFAQEMYTWEGLNLVFALARADRERFLRACFWFQQGNHARSASVRFTAIISAVETLMPSATSGPPCEVCGRAKGPGTTRQFASFVDAFAPWIPAEERSRLYGLRSALSHGGTLFHSDRATLLGGLEPSVVKEWITRDIAFRLVRAVLIGWLLKNP